MYSRENSQPGCRKYNDRSLGSSGFRGNNPCQDEGDGREADNHLQHQNQSPYDVFALFHLLSIRGSNVVDRLNYASRLKNCRAPHGHFCWETKTR
jgi:hypothetical protein